MSVLDVESLLSELSPDAPSGKDLEYDPRFVELEQLMKGTPDQEFGNAGGDSKNKIVIPGKPPEWKRTKPLALDLLGETRDLRIALMLSRTLIHTDGWPGFADSLQLIQGLLERLWESFHPQLDPDDDNDPTMRVNALVSLCDSATFLRHIREAPFVASRVHGRYALRDIEMALDEIPVPKDVTKPVMTTIEAAFMDVDLAELQATAAAIGQSLASATAIEAELTRRVGAGRSADLSEVARLLKRVHAIVMERVVNRGGAEAATEVAEDSSTEGGVPGAPAGAAVVQRIAGEIATREDVIKTIDKICAWYERAEPASPVPLLLQRAKRLVPMGFMDLLQDLAPEGIPQVEKIRGKREGE